MSNQMLCRQRMGIGWIFLLLVGCTPSVTQMPTIRIPKNNPIPTFTPFPFSTHLPKLTPSPTTAYRPITWMELQDFLSKDHTNWNKFTTKYVCVNFALDLVVNAKKQNINAWIVGVSFKGNAVGHAFVAFETTNKGIVWIDPQSDYSFQVVDIGKHLCSNVVDTNLCEFGAITEILQPLECDAVTHECFEK